MRGLKGLGVIAIAILTALPWAVTPAKAGTRFTIGIGLGTPIYTAPAYVPAPIYAPPAPAYVVPQSIYPSYAPGTVVVQAPPAPAYGPLPGYYSAPVVYGSPVYSWGW